MKIKSVMYYKRRPTGFTLVEVLVSVALMSLVGIYFINAQIDSVREKVVESVAQDVLTLANSSMAYFSEVDEWPDQAASCADVVGVLAGLGAFPVGTGGTYQGPNDVTLDTTCTSLGSVGSTLRITVTFPAGGQEDADLLMGYLPTSSKPSANSTIVTHYVAAPRRASEDRYNFYKLMVETTLGIDSSFQLAKPACPGGGSNAEYMLIPQSLCINGTSNGLGGYYFKELSTSTSTNWHLQLLVADGNNTSSGQFFALTNPFCDSQRITVGAITYCD